jgi:hypothetical protein
MRIQFSYDAAGFRLLPRHFTLRIREIRRRKLLTPRIHFGSDSKTFLIFTRCPNQRGSRAPVPLRVQRAYGLGRHLTLPP